MLRQALRLACAVVLMSGVLATPVTAQTSDKRTLFTFNAPVAMPGVTLPAGQYLFRVADPMTSGKVIEVRSGDGSKHYGLFFSYPAERFEPSGTPEVRFMETAKGAPAAIKTWWYPGERRGYEFIYPKDQAARLARGAAQPVLTTHASTTTAEQTNTQELARISSTGEETSFDAAAAPIAAAASGTTQEGAVASSALSIPNATVPAAVTASGAPASAVTANAARTSTRSRLPQTASATPTIAAIGAIALLGGVAVRAWRRGGPSATAR